jgi:hypothetical protein
LKGDPPERTMTLVEARQLIGSLVITWLDWLVHPQAHDLSTKYRTRRPATVAGATEPIERTDDRR